MRPEIPHVSWASGPTELLWPTRPFLISQNERPRPFEKSDFHLTDGRGRPSYVRHPLVETVAGSISGKLGSLPHEPKDEFHTSCIEITECVALSIREIRSIRG